MIYAILILINKVILHAIFISGSILKVPAAEELLINNK